jgi:aspartyl-tRNA(Asn)/glutamyl-tRNA(Gln) amidotransferase subunit A
MSIRAGAELVRKKRVSPVELTTEWLARIDRVNSALNSFFTITGDSILQQAREAEAGEMAGAAADALVILDCPLV